MTEIGGEAGDVAIFDVEVTTGRRITIPHKVSERLGITKGTMVRFTVVPLDEVDDEDIDNINPLNKGIFEAEVPVDKRITIPSKIAKRLGMNVAGTMVRVKLEILDFGEA